MLITEKVDQLSADSNLVHAWVNGPATGIGSSITTDAGLVRTPAKLIADINAEFTASIAGNLALATAQAVAASNSAADALVSLNDFKGRYYGALAVAPTLDPLGAAINVGDTYFDSANNLRKTFNGTVWQVDDIIAANLAVSTGTALVEYTGDFIRRKVDPGSGGALTWMQGAKENVTPTTSGGCFINGGTAANPHTVGANSELSVIGGAYDNHIGDTASASTIAGGAHHNIATNASHGAILGGSYQTVNAPYGVAGGGTLNTVNGTYAVVAGGQSNVAGDSTLAATDSRSAFVGAGALNIAKGLRSAIVAGASNLASGAEAFIGAGNNNTASGADAFIGGGNTNIASGVQATIPGGVSCTASGTSSFASGDTALASASYAVAQGEFLEASGASSIAQGSRSKAYLRAQRSLAAGYFTAKGDAQISALVMRGITTTASVTLLGLTSTSGEKLVLPVDTTWGFSIMVVARRTDVDGENAVYKFEGCIKKDTNSASTALVGSATKTVLAESTAVWDCNVSANTTNGDLQIDVMGEAAKTIRWVAKIELVEVTG